MRNILRLLVSGLVIIGVLIVITFITLTSVTLITFMLLVIIFIIAIGSALVLISVFFGGGDLKIEKNGSTIFRGSPRDYLKQKAKR